MACHEESWGTHALAGLWGNPRGGPVSAQRFDVFAGMSGMACVTCFATAATSKFLKVQGAICVQPPYVYVQTIAMLVNVRISEKSWRHWRRVGNKLPYAFRPQSFHASHFCLLPPNVACLLRWITLSPLWALEWHWVWLYLWCRPYLPSYFQSSFQEFLFFSVEVAGSSSFSARRQSEAKTSKNVSEVISKDLQDLLVQFIMSRWAWFMMWNGGRTKKMLCDWATLLHQLQWSWSQLDEMISKFFPLTLETFVSVWFAPGTTGPFLYQTLLEVAVCIAQPFAGAGPKCLGGNPGPWNSLDDRL